jgi:hypothetical protein
LKQREPTDSPSGSELDACVVKTRYRWKTNSDFPPETNLLSAGSEKRAKFAGETEKKRAFLVVQV